MQAETTTQTPSLPLRVRRDGDRVVIDGIRHPGFGTYASSVHGARAVILAALGENFSYEELVGYDALAFRVQFMSGFCPSSPHSCCGYNCAGRSVAAMPWEANFHGVADLQADNPAHAERIRDIRRLVMASIDRGVPVEYGDFEDGVIIGYQAGGAEWICTNPWKHNAEPYVEKELTWGMMIFAGPKQTRPDLAALARASLQQAAAMWHTPRAGRGDGYYVGEAAWQQWIAELGQPQDEKKLSERQHGNAWIYESLIRHRQCAAVYLRKVGPLLGPSAAEHLDKAAVLYESMADEVLMDAEHPFATIAPQPWNGPWTSEQRAEQARRMKEAMDLDGRATAELEAALGAI